LPSV